MSVSVCVCCLCLGDAPRPTMESAVRTELGRGIRISGKREIPSEAGEIVRACPMRSAKHDNRVEDRASCAGPSHLVTCAPSAVGADKRGVRFAWWELAARARAVRCFEVSQGTAGLPMSVHLLDRVSVWYERRNEVRNPGLRARHAALHRSHRCPSLLSGDSSGTAGALEAA